MRLCSSILIFLICILFKSALTEDFRVKKNDSVTETKQKTPRQLEYLSLIGTLLQQTSVLSSVDGILIAASTVIAATLARARPLLVAGFMSYLLYAGTALLAPGAVARMGIVPQRGARSAAGGIIAETLMRSVQINPVMSILTNVSVSVVTDASSRMRLIVRSLSNQLHWLQSRIAVWSRALQTSCVERFLCRVGRFTQDVFPIAAAALRSIGSSSPGLDSFAVAIVRGTSSSNCSLIYPDCTI